MKVFLTGQKQIGKSTCIRTFLERNKIPVCGFQTLPVYEEGRRTGFCMHAFVDIAGNDRVFSVQHDTYNEVIPEVFDGFGCEVLQKSMELSGHMLMLDEIGVLEKDEIAYLALLKEAVRTHRNVVGVLKKKEAAHNDWLLHDPQIRIIDLDEVSFAEALGLLERSWYHTNHTGCVILAAGNSARFGGNKLLHELSGGKVIEHIMEKVARLPLSEAVVVTQYGEICRLCEERGMAYVRNEMPDKGLSYSIRLGTEALWDCGHILFVLADQPDLKTETLHRILEAADDTHVVCACAGGVVQNPMLFPAAFFDELTELRGDKGAKSVALKHEMKMISVEESELRDLDRPEDLDKFE